MPVAAGLLFIIATIPLLFGAVQPWVWSVYSAVIILLYIFSLWKQKKSDDTINSRLFVATVGVFYVFTFLQCLPLPLEVIGILSPFEFQIFHQSSDLLGIPDFYHTLSYIPVASFSRWIYLLSLLLLFLMLKQQLIKRRLLLSVVVLMVGVALLESVYGLVQALVPTLGVLWVDYISSYLGDARGTFINRNHFAGYIEMVWPLGLALIFGLGSRCEENSGNNICYKNQLKGYLSGDRFGFILLCCFSTLFILLSLLFSRSRAGIAGGFVGFLSFTILVHVGGRRFSKLVWGLFFLSGLFLLIYGNLIGFDQFMGRLFALEEGAGSRLDIWQDSLAISRAHPFGIGLRNFEYVMPVFNTSGSLGIKYNHAHNDYLQLLIETGWIGFASMVAGLCIFIIKSVKKIHKNGLLLDPLRFYIGIGACSGILSIAFHSFFDFNLQIPANTLYFVVLIALAYSCLFKQQTDPSNK